MVFDSHDTTVFQLTTTTPLSIVTFNEQEDVRIYHKEDTNNRPNKIKIKSFLQMHFPRELHPCLNRIQKGTDNKN